MKRPPQIKVTVSKHNSTDYWAVHIDDKLAVVALLRGLLPIASRKYARLAAEKALSAPEAENVKLESATDELTRYTVDVIGQATSKMRQKAAA
jgi:hypothetical protein